MADSKGTNPEGIFEHDGEIVPEYEKVREGIYEKQLEAERFKPVPFEDLRKTLAPQHAIHGKVDAWDRTKREAGKLGLTWMAGDKDDKPVIMLTVGDEEPDSNGIYENLYYTNGAGNLENVYSMTMRQALQEANHREKIRKNTGEPYYFIQSDHHRFKGWTDGNPDQRARSTEGNDFRKKSIVAEMISGTLRTKAYPSIGYDEEADEFTLEEKYMPASRGVVGTIGRATLETMNIAFDAGSRLMSGIQELEKASRFNIEHHGRGYVPGSFKEGQEKVMEDVYFPNRHEINDMLQKPEAELINQFTALLIPNTMISGIFIKSVGTFRNGKKIYKQAARDTLKKMRDEGDRGWRNLRGPERIIAKRDFLEKMRRELDDKLEKELGQSYLRATGLRKMIRKGRFEAHLNPKKWLAENGLAELGITSGMILSHRNFADSKDPNDPFALFGYMNTAIGIIGAVSSGAFPSALSGVGHMTGVNKIIGNIIPHIRYSRKDHETAMAVLEGISTGPAVWSSGALNHLSRKARKKVMQMVDDIHGIKDAKIREEIINSAKDANRTMKDLIKLNPESEEWIKEVHVSLGQMFNVSNLMAAEEYLIRTARGGGTVSFNLVDASAKIQFKRLQATRSLESMLEKAGAMDTSGLTRETKIFLGEVRKATRLMKTDDAASAIRTASFIETGVESKLAKMGISKDPLNAKEVEEFDIMIEHYGRSIEGLEEGVEKAASFKRLQILIEQRNALRLAKLQDKLIEFEGDPKAQSKLFQQIVHTDGSSKLNKGRRKYKIAKRKLKNVELSGEYAENYFLGLSKSLEFSTANKIVGRHVDDIQDAVNFAVRDKADETIDEVLRSLEPEDEAFNSLKTAFLQAHKGYDSLDMLTMLIKAKQSGESMGGISKQALANLNIKMDYLDMDAINQLVNQKVKGLQKGLNKDARASVKNSALAEFFAQHDNAYKDWENTIGKAAIKASGIKEAKRYWIEETLPASLNNRLWQAIKYTTEGKTTNLIKGFSYLDDMKLLDDPDEFIKDATRLFGKFDPKAEDPITGQIGRHVLTKNGKKIVGNLLTNYIGSKIAKETAKLKVDTKLKPIKVSDLDKVLKGASTDEALEKLTLRNLRFGKNFSNSLIDQLDVLDNALRREGIDDIVDKSIFGARDYNKILSTNQLAQDAFGEAVDVIKQTKMNWGPKLKSLQVKENLFTQELDQISAGTRAIKNSQDFYEKLVVENQGEILRKLKMTLTQSIKGRKPQMTVEEFNEIVSRNVASGIRRMSEAGPMQLEKVAVKPPKSLLTKKVEQFQDIRVSGAEDIQPVKPWSKAGEVVEEASDMRMATRVSGAKLISNLDDNADTLKEILGEEHFNNMRIVGKVLEIIQRAPISADSPEVLKASKMTMGGLTSRMYAVFSGRVSWRYVGAEALFLNMSKNEAYAITQILADPNATKAIAYMVVSGKPIINRLSTTDKLTAWMPEAFIAATDTGFFEYERMWERERYIRKFEEKQWKEKFHKQMDRLFETAPP